MKIPVQNLDTALASTNALTGVLKARGRKVPGHMYLQLINLATELKGQAQAIVAASTQLAYDHAERDADDKVVWKEEIDPETGKGVIAIKDQAAYATAIAELMSGEATINTEPLRIDALLEAGVEPGDLAGMSTLIEVV